MDLTLPLFGRTGLSDSSRLTNLMLVAFTAFRLKQRPAENVSEPVLTGRYVTVGGATPGLFGGMRYRTREGEVLVESACSSFFLLAALLVLDGRMGALDF